MDNTQYIGIDISCKTFDVAIYTDNKKMRHRQFDNDVNGFESLMSWLKKKAETTWDKAHLTTVLSFPMACSSFYG